MEPSLLTSLIGILIFTILMYFGFKYANGNWKVSESKKSEYLNWTNKHGKTIKKGIIIISIIYGISMLIQISSLI
jgi:TRAP-type C4-dicarboxylate transport system permease small subunit